MNSLSSREILIVSAFDVSMESNITYFTLNKPKSIIGSRVDIERKANNEMRDPCLRGCIWT